jgi:HEAT repeat protein
MKSPTRRRLILLVSLSPCLLLMPPACRAQLDPATDVEYDPVIDSAMYHDPELPQVPRLRHFPEGAKPLWVKALARPEADLKCQAADAIARAAREGVKGIDTMTAPLVEELDRPEQNPSARRAIAEALIALDAREAAPNLFRQAQAGGNDLREQIEPALARWDHRPARAVWLARLADPATPRRELLLAIRGLATVREEKAADRLRELALSQREPGPARLEAAMALAALRESGLEKDAESMLTDATPRGIVNRLVAASLLRRHKGDEATRLLQRLAKDPEPAVAAIAVGRLLELDPALVLPALDSLLASPDAGLRSLGVDVLFRVPSEKHVHLLGDRLDDADIGVRRKARRFLGELAGKKVFHDPVILEGERLLAGRQWQGLEQAAILLTQLDHKEAVGRLVDLLTFDRPEVFTAAAWGLRKLDVPETLPRVRDYVGAELGRIRAGRHLPSRKEVPTYLMDHQLSQLNQFMGRRKYPPADDVLRQFIPHNANQPIDESRGAAIWALGLIHEGKSVPDLAAALIERLNDVTSIPPESWQVRRMSAVALGRMKAKEALPSLRTFYPDGIAVGNPIHDACGWAVQQITGEVMPPPKLVETMNRDWFLTPDR